MDSTVKFKVGDKVRRRVEDQCTSGWKYGDRVFEITSILRDSACTMLYLRGASTCTWNSTRFELVTDTTALATQVGGTHYKSLPIQPIDYITKNNLGWCEGNIIKYITRWKQKGGIADIDKVIHYAEILKGMQPYASNP